MAALMCLTPRWLFANIGSMQRNLAGEYNLTDMVRVAGSQGRPIGSISVDASEIMGVNTESELREVECRDARARSDAAEPVGSRTPKRPSPALLKEKSVPGRTVGRGWRSVRAQMAPNPEEWVITATHRQDRTFLPPDDYCPLCPTKPGAFPPRFPPRTTRS